MNGTNNLKTVFAGAAFRSRAVRGSAMDRETVIRVAILLSVIALSIGTIALAAYVFTTSPPGMGSLE